MNAAILSHEHMQPDQSWLSLSFSYLDANEWLSVCVCVCLFVCYSLVF